MFAVNYFFGKGTECDEKKTLQYYKLAAKTKHPEGVFRLGCAYL
jgi:TPR repeat protein